MRVNPKVFPISQKSLSREINVQAQIDHAAGRAYEGQDVSKFKKSPRTYLVLKNYKQYLSERGIS